MRPCGFECRKASRNLGKVDKLIKGVIIKVWVLAAYKMVHLKMITCEFVTYG